LYCLVNFTQEKKKSEKVNKTVPSKNNIYISGKVEREKKSYSAQKFSDFLVPKFI
jgi:hypothetical protein